MQTTSPSLSPSANFFCCRMLSANGFVRSRVCKLQGEMTGAKAMSQKWFNPGTSFAVRFAWSDFSTSWVMARRSSLAEVNVRTRYFAKSRDFLAILAPTPYAGRRSALRSERASRCRYPRVRDLWRFGSRNQRSCALEGTVAVRVNGTSLLSRRRPPFCKTLVLARILRTLKQVSRIFGELRSPGRHL
jgi:hypothetical protein